MKTFLAVGSCMLMLVSSPLHGDGSHDRLSFLEEVSVVRSGIDDPEVGYTVTRLAGHPAQTQGSSASVAWAGDMVRVEREHETPGGRTAFVAATADGTNGWQYFALTRTAVRLAAPTEHHEIGGVGLFELMAFFPEIPHGVNRGEERDLESILGEETRIVHEQLEEVEGAACVVVDAMQGGYVHHRLWLDPDRSSMPRRQELLFSGADETAVVIRVTEFSQVDGIWLPASAMRTSPATDRYETGFVPVVSSVSVDRDHAGQLSLAVNSTLASSLFDSSTELPPGTLAGDRTTGESWIVSGQDFRSSANAALASLGEEGSRILSELSPSEESGARTVHSASLGLPWLVMAGVSLALALVGGAPRLRGGIASFR